MYSGAVQIEQPLFINQIRSQPSRYMSEEILRILMKALQKAMVGIMELNPLLD